jgi:hypothetical protein
MLRALFVVAAFSACSDDAVRAFNSPPTASIVSPEDGEYVPPGDLVEFFGLAKDDQDESPKLGIAWSSDIDGALDASPADPDGSVYFASARLSHGTHAITLTVADTDGETASASIALNVGTGGGNDDGSPRVTITGPADGAMIPSSTEVNLAAVVTDDIDLPGTIDTQVVDSVDGLIYSGLPTETGVLSMPMRPSLGAHTLTVSAVDSEGKVGTASVAYTLVQDDRPYVRITAPADGARYLTTDVITFRGEVSDDMTAKEVLGISWSSDYPLALSSAPADSNGDASFSTALPGGTHTITLAAVDGDGKDGRDTIVITVTDPRDIDDDGDGYTENQGDCDDNDRGLNPGEEDICDDLDNDCSGYINDPFFDVYEVNNTLETAYDAGRVDEALGWANASLELSGLTLSDRTDEDWIRWDAKDEIYDNVTVSVSASGFKAGGTYVLELWSLDTGRIEDSDSGPSGLSVSYEGDVFDTGEDDWAIRIYATTWVAGSCDQAYKVTLRS